MNRSIFNGVCVGGTLALYLLLKEVSPIPALVLLVVYIFFGGTIYSVIFDRLTGSKDLTADEWRRLDSKKRRRVANGIVSVKQAREWWLKDKGKQKHN